MTTTPNRSGSSWSNCFSIAFIVLCWGLISCGCGKSSDPAAVEGNELEQAKALTRLEADGHRYGINATQPPGAAFGEDRAYLIRQGMEAIRALLEKERANEEAQLCLAVCLVDGEIQELEEGRSLLNRLINESKQPRLVLAARWSLAQSLDAPDRDPERATKLYRRNWEESSPAKVRQSYHSILLPRYEEAFVQGALEIQDFVEWLVRHDEVEAEVVTSSDARENGKGSRRLFRSSIDMLEVLLSKNTSAAETYLNATVENLEQKHPSVVPYFCARLGNLALTNLPPVFEERHVESMEWCLANEGQIHEVEHLLKPVLLNVMQKHATHIRLVPGVKVAEVIRELGPGRLDQAEIDLAVFHVGWMHRHQRDYAKAIEWFELMEGREVKVRQKGYWGRFGVHNGDVLVEECRLLADGKSPHDRLPPRELLGAPELAFWTPHFFKFVSDGPLLWFLDGDTLLEYAKATGKTNSITQVKPGIGPDVTDMVAGEGHIWIATQGHGLIAVDKQTQKVTSYTRQEGLYADDLSAVWFSPGRIWLGFGKTGKRITDKWARERTFEGIGYLNLSDLAFVGIPGAKAKGVQVNSASGEASADIAPHANAPDSFLSTLHMESDSSLLGLSRHRLHRYDIGEEEWSVLLEARYLTCMDVNEKYIITGANELAASSSESSQGYGGLRVRNQSQETWQHIGRKEGLPHGTFFSVALDGERAWAGGRGYLAQINLPEGKVDKLHVARDGSAPIHQLSIDGNELWFVHSQLNYGESVRIYLIKLD